MILSKKRLIDGRISIDHFFADQFRNALGHQLIAQIAYNNMTPHARLTFQKYNHAMDKVYKPQSFINAAVSLDKLRYQDIAWFSTMHYIDLPFTNDGTQLFPPQEINAVWAMKKSALLIENKYANAFDKGTALRVILHVAGDLHQPLHAATRVSEEFPEGDKGGNLVQITGSSSIASNLHAYWDNGAGILKIKPAPTVPQIVKMAASIEERWPCQVTNVDITPEHWAEESHEIAVKIAYKKLPIDHVPNNKYQNLAKIITLQRVALAGCRLAAFLNKMDDHNILSNQT